MNLEKRKNETEAILEEILDNNFQILTRDIKPHLYTFRKHCNFKGGKIKERKHIDLLTVNL